MTNHGNNPQAMRYHWLTVIAICAALGLTLTACDNSGSGNKASTQESTAKPENTATTGEEAGMAETAAQTQATDASEEMPMTENTNTATEAETTDTGATQQTAESETQDREPMSGREVYTRFCVICHKAGLNGAPKYGDKRAWGERVKQGKETVYSYAINGLRAMPPKGGVAGLYDQEVKDAVDFIINGSGGWGSAE